MKVLMGVDDSEFSGDLVRAIVKQFRSETTEVLVLRVLEQAGPAVPEMDAGYAPEMEGEGKVAHALVDRIARELRGAGFKADTAVEVGDVRESIIDAAMKWGADLIVVGSHGQRGIRGFLLGSAAEFVARHASCPWKSSAGRKVFESVMLAGLRWKTGLCNATLTRFQP